MSSQARKSLFDLVVPESRLHPHFAGLRTWPGSEPARRMLEDVYQDFEDPEGNFLEQYQTTGFDARYFELYLYAYFARSGFSVERRHPNPDFIVERDDLRVAVEATTVNPSTSGTLSKHGKKISELAIEEMRDYQQHELPIRFGGPLFTKLQKRYWELAHCRDLPFVIAIEAFYDERALAMSSEGVSRFVYGLQQTGSWTKEGTLRIDTKEVSEHELGEKRVPSYFFGQPDTEHISAVLFTNSGTNAKFARIGYQSGYGCDVVDITRTGFAFNPDPNAMDPTFFSYNLDEPPMVESWGQGLVVLHNPNCLRPVPPEFFVDAVQGTIENGVFKSTHPEWDPIASQTMILYLGDLKKQLPKQLRRKGRLAVAAITKEQFQAIWGYALLDSNPIGEEHGWFTDESTSFLGVVVRDKIDNDWGFVVLARDPGFNFRAITVETSLASRDRARMLLQLKIAELLEQPQRIFPQE